uniref:Protein kinase domain-containing protein n=1 Tax=Amphora coffeiformis TaxID=265554 RepID=A0A6S8KP57_9STRA
MPQVQVRQQPQHHTHPLEPLHHYHHVHHTHHVHKRFWFFVTLTGLLAWTWVYDTSQTSLLDPRKLMAEGEEMSTGRGKIMVGGAGAMLLRTTTSQTDAFVGGGLVEVPVEVDLTQATVSVALDNHNNNNNSPDKNGNTTWNRVVYLINGSEESWRLHSSRNHTVAVEPHMSDPGDPRGMNQDHDYDDNDNTGPEEPLGGEDPIRWYPQIDSNDERFHIERKGWPRHEIHPDRCRPMHAWQSDSFPVCNTIHETNLGQSLVEQNLYMISKKGFWRHAWGSHDSVKTTTATTNSGNETLRRKMVWKTFKINHGMEDAFFENNRVDALAMERLTASPHIIDIYGFCGMTVIQEYAGGELHELKLNSTEKLDLAIGLAQGIRDIHHIDDSKVPAMAHNDINLANIIVTDDGRPVLNDFNIAVLLMEDKSYDDEDEEGKVCPFYGRFPNPQWRSPEEQVDSEEESKNNPPVVNEKIDIYAMGNVLFRLVAGVSPWKKEGQSRLTAEDKIEVALAKRYKGALPELPSDVDLRTPAMAVLNEAMQMCYRFDPDERPSAKELVKFLETARTNLATMTEQTRQVQ